MYFSSSLICYLRCLFFLPKDTTKTFSRAEIDGSQCAVPADCAMQSPFVNPISYKVCINSIKNISNKIVIITILATVEQLAIKPC